MDVLRSVDSKVDVDNRFGWGQIHVGRFMWEGEEIRLLVWVVGGVGLLGGWFGSLNKEFRRVGVEDDRTRKRGVSCVEASSFRQSCRTLYLFVLVVMGEETLGWMSLDGVTTGDGIEGLGC